MSVEVVGHPSSEVVHDVLTMSAVELKKELDSILHATTETEARAYELSFEDITRLFLDSHNEKTEQLHQAKREMILETMLENPSEAFHGEFLQLKLLYSDRVLKEDRWDGTQIDEFCTQNHARHTCDYLFEHRVLPSGKEIFEVRKVYMIFGKPDQVTITLNGDELQVKKQEYERGRTSYRELEGDDRERILAQFFYDTIHASALQVERSHDDREENDRRARGYLHAIRKNDRILL